MWGRRSIVVWSRVMKRSTNNSLLRTTNFARFWLTCWQNCQLWRAAVVSHRALVNVVMRSLVSSLSIFAVITLSYGRAQLSYRWCVCPSICLSHKTNDRYNHAVFTTGSPGTLGFRFRTLGLMGTILRGRQTSLRWVKTVTDCTFSTNKSLYLGNDKR